jgi:hypothetical protein
MHLRGTQDPGKIFYKTARKLPPSRCTSTMVNILGRCVLLQIELPWLHANTIYRLKKSIVRVISTPGPSAAAKTAGL